MKYNFRRRTKEDIQAFLSWHFEGVYSFYDNDIQKEKLDWYWSSIENEDAFSIYNDHNELVGSCEFSIDEGEYIMGLQMKPELTGQGMGVEFSNAVIKFGKERYDFKALYLAVATFNKRATKVYEKLGFEVIEEDVWNIRGNDYNFLIMKKQF